MKKRLHASSSSVTHSGTGSMLHSKLRAGGHLTDVDIASGRSCRDQPTRCGCRRRRSSFRGFESQCRPASRRDWSSYHRCRLASLHGSTHHTARLADLLHRAVRMAPPAIHAWVRSTGWGRGHWRGAGWGGDLDLDRDPWVDGRSSRLELPSAREGKGALMQLILLEKLIFLLLLWLSPHTGQVTS
jgi:hypothetical protein